LFDTGLNIAVNESGNTMAATVLYRQDTQRLFCFNGIDGTATYDDVGAAFGAHPDVVREGPDELKTISFFLSEMPYSKDE